MAGQALERPNIELPPEPIPNLAAEKVEIEVSELQLTAARLYGQGYKRAQVKSILLDHLAPAKRPGKRDRTREEQQSHANAKLRRWERTQKFRDLLYQHAVVELDLNVPDILHGVAQKAKRGRVDAARLALEVTGRHNPRGEDKPTQITVQIANIPRPDGQ